MVVRVLKYGSALFSSLLLAVLVVVFWLIWSPPGSAWLLAVIFERSPVEISVDRVSGRLADDVQLDGVRVHWSEGTILAERISLNWSLSRLFSGELNVAELALSGVDILLDSSGEAGSESTAPFVFHWPQLSGWPLRVSADINILQIDRLTIRSPEETLWQCEHLRTGARWSEGVLTISDVDLASSDGTLTGQLSGDLVSSHLTGELRVTLAQNIAGVERTILKFNLGVAKDSSAMVGRIESLLYDAQKAWFDVSAEVELSGETLHVNKGEIRFPGDPDRLLVQGRLQLKKDLPWQATAQVEQLDFSDLAGVPLRLFGQVNAEGDLDEYRGRVNLENRVDGWLKARLAGTFAGDLDQIGFSALNGELLGGRVEGDLVIRWLDGFSLRSTTVGRDLDLAALAPEWPGRVNLDLRTELLQTGDDPLVTHLSGELLESILLGKGLAGEFDLRLQGEEVDIAHLDLHGEGIDLTAAGRLSRRVDFAASAGRLSGLIPGLKGRMNAEGWLSRTEGEISGHLALQGRELSYAEVSIDRLSLSADKSVGSNRFIITAEGKDGMAGGRQVDSLSLALQGSPEAHGGTLDVLSSDGNGRIQLTGGYHEGRWDGALTELSLSQTPFGDWALAKETGVQVDAQSVQLAPLKLVSPLGETVELDGAMTLVPLNGAARLHWSALRLSHVEPWLNDWTASGTTSGDVQLHVETGDLLEFSSQMTIVGGLARGGQQFDMTDGLLTLDWNRQGLTGQARADFGDLGLLTAQVSSAEPARSALPSAGDFSVRFDGLSLSRLDPWGPESLDVEGMLSGSTDGNWVHGAELRLAGKAQILDGRLKWHEDEKILAAELREAVVDWNWGGDRLSGNAVLVLHNQGRLQANFELPLSVRRPFAFAPDGAVRGTLSGYLDEQGLLTALFPGSVRETKGQLAFDWTIGGLWSQPKLGGSFSLTGASAYLPEAGVQLKDVGLKGRLAEDRIFLDAFSMGSGSGRIEGTGEVQLADWHPKEYRLQLGGKDFQLVNLPELQLAISPDLLLSGNLERVKLRGSITIPEALVAARDAPSPVVSSSDVVIVDADIASPEKVLPVSLDARVRILLGDRVTVKANGIDARLGGEVELQFVAIDEVLAQGEIHVVKGDYSAYGVKLNIDRGNVVFAGGPVDRPTLDILALRKTDEVKAGVTVTGTPRQPVVKLYSEPLMPDIDILSYVVLGRPLGSDSGQSSLLMTAAGALLSKGESAVLQDRLKRRLGLDVLEVQAGNGDVSSSMVTIGKYLNPKLYVSLGHALFTNSNEFRMRYRLADHWEFESNVGLESGADLYYRIEFD